MQKGRVALRSKQFELALAGNPTMLIWLGKQVLGQRDKIDQEIGNKEGRALKTETILNLSEEVKKYAHLLGNVTSK
jgi:hypothetical protein